MSHWVVDLNKTKRDWEDFTIIGWLCTHCRHKIMLKNPIKANHKFGKLFCILKFGNYKNLNAFKMLSAFFGVF